MTRDSVTRAAAVPTPTPLFDALAQNRRYAPDELFAGLLFSRLGYREHREWPQVPDQVEVVDVVIEPDAPPPTIMIEAEPVDSPRALPAIEPRRRTRPAKRPTGRAAGAS